MRFSWLFCGLLAVSSEVLSANTDVLAPQTGSSRLYIVTLRQQADIKQHIRFISNPQHSDYVNATVLLAHEYTFPGFSAYAASLTPTAVKQIRSRSDVSSVEPDGRWTRSGAIDDIPSPDNQTHTLAIERKPTTSWALAAISHRTPHDQDKTYILDSSAGAGTYAYMLDDGIVTDHVGFQGRAVRGYNALPQVPFVDSIGHGTMMAGIVGSELYGVAPRCTLIAVKVIDSTHTATSFVLDGYAWAVNQIVKRKRQAKAVVSISLNGPKSHAWDAAVNAAVKRGVTTVVSAGNGGQDAGMESAGNAEGAICVSAVDKGYERPWWANYGRLVKMFAPGVRVESTSIGSANASRFGSGTSHAAAHVAGLVLYAKGLMWLQNDGATRNWLFKNAMKGYVIDPLGSSNRFAYNGNGA